MLFSCAHNVLNGKARALWDQVDWLLSVPLFDGLAGAEHILDRLAGLLMPRAVAPGELLIEKGDTSTFWTKNIDNNPSWVASFVRLFFVAQAQLKCTSFVVANLKCFLTLMMIPWRVLVLGVWLEKKRYSQQPLDQHT
eukprot:SAG31_NODE_13956_length_835_cov_0.831522_1_plen_138_part_00